MKFFTTRFKSTSTILVVIFMINLMFSGLLTVSAQESNQLPDSVVAQNTSNDIVVDGSICETTEWDISNELTYKSANANNSAKFGALWDSEYLYVKVDVTDSNVINSGAEYLWNDDSVEFYIDGNMNKGEYDSNTCQYILRWNDSTVYKANNTTCSTDGIIQKQQSTTEGYTMEIAIPWQTLGISPVGNQYIGFTIHVNDKDTNDSNAPADSYLALTLQDQSYPDWFTSVNWIDLKLEGDGTQNPQEGQLFNGGFEESEDGVPKYWNTYGCNVVCTTEKANSGNYSLKMFDESNENNLIIRSNHIPVEPEQGYVAKAFCYTVEGSADLYLEFWDDNDNRIGVTYTTCNSLNQWSEVVCEGTSPAAAAYATVLVYLGKSNIGITYFDDVSFEEKTDDSQVGFNGGFEESENGIPKNWNTYGTNAECTTEKAHSGDYSIRMVDESDEGNVLLRSSHIPVVPDQEYVAKAFYYTVEGSSDLYLEFWDDNNTRVGVTYTTCTPSGQWSETVCEGTSPATAVYATVLLYLNSSNIGTTYFDDVSFEEKMDDGQGEIREFPVIVNDHPRLYFTKEDIPGLRTKAQNETLTPFGFSGKKIWSDIENTARAYLNEESFTVVYYGGYQVTYELPPEQPGQMPVPPGFTGGTMYPYWTAMASQLQKRMETLSIAYVVTGEQEFADRAKSYALALCDWTSWTDPYYIDGNKTCLDTAHITFGVSTVYDLLYDILTDEERLKIENALENKAFKDLYYDIRIKSDSNIQMLKAIALGSGVAAVIDKNPDANKYLTRAVDYYTWYLDARMNSGNNEGLLYTDYVMENLMRVIDQLARVTGEMELIEHSFINDFIVRWALYNLSTGGNGCANISDCSVNSYFYITMSVINAWLDNGYAGWYLTEAKPKAEPMDRFIYFNPDGVITLPDTLPSSTMLEEIGWASLRSGFDREDTLLTFVSNNSLLSHNHYDQNSFIISNNGTWIAADPGYQDFSPGPANEFTNWYGHNTVLVNGEGQSRRGGGSLTEGLLSSTYDYVKGSAAQSYKNKIDLFDRHIVYAKPNYFVILDDLKAPEASTYEWVLYSGSGTNYEVDGQQVMDQIVEGNDIYIQKGFSQMAVKFLSEGKMPITVEKYEGAESYGPYVKVGSGDASTEKRFLSVLKVEPYDTGVIQSVDLLSTVECSGKEYKVVSSTDFTTIFYRSGEPSETEKDYISFVFPVSKDDTYNVDLEFIKSPLYGQVQAYIDGNPVGGVFDGYNPEIMVAPSFSLGEMRLEEGNHTIKLEVVGKNENSSNYYMGFSGIKFTSVNEEDQTIKKTEIDAQLVINEEAIGAKVNRGYITDLVLFKDSEVESFNLESVESDAEQALVSFDHHKAVKGYAMTRGKVLKYTEKTLLEAQEPFSASFGINERSNNLELEVDVSSSMNISFYTGFEPVIVLNGEQIEKEQYTYDEMTGLVTILLNEGLNKMIFSNFQQSRITVQYIQQFIEDYTASGDLKEPLAYKLTNALNQAEHQLNIGLTDHAIKHMEDFLKHLNNKGMQENISEVAKDALIIDANTLIQFWSE